MEILHSEVVVACRNGKQWHGFLTYYIFLYLRGEWIKCHLGYVEIRSAQSI